MSLLFLLLTLLDQPQTDPYQHFLIPNGSSECLLVRDPESKIDPGGLIEYAVRQGFYSIRLQGGAWSLARPVLLQGVSGPLWIHGDPADAPVLENRGGVIFSIRRSAGITIENLDLHGRIEMDETEDISMKRVRFFRSGIVMRGRRCNQPAECTSYNRRILVEECVFDQCETAIRAERLEESTLIRNRFTGEGNESSCETHIGIDLDGSSEDLDRKLEYGHSKGNQIEANLFEQEFAIGIRVKESIGNIFRDNRFYNSYRAFEFLQGARHNQVQSTIIGYLSQLSPSSACHTPCGVYLGPGSLGNVLLNNFFEQKFELQFLDRHRNRLFVVDESGNQNVIHSDLPTLF